ncbi:restriction endonuclease subunit S [Methylocaldum gracile]|jgi:type I restriction enzyme S subunit|uniref:restriction endonuclease subunit S n=1 Tax=Methylocaldum sp. 0917 TaxID=2485163 RepID=UPI00106057EF
MSELFAPPFARYQLSELAAPGTDSFVDGPFGSSLKSHEYVDAGVRLIQLQNIGEGEWRDENRKFITLRKFKSLERHGAIPGDIAIAKMADPVARACIVPPVAEQFVVVADCIRLRLDQSRFDTGFVVRAINSPYTRREAEKKAIGSTRIRINLSVLKTVGCLAPELSEQKAISRILDTLDTAIHETEAIIAKLKAVKQGLLHDLLTRGIDANGELRPPQAEAPHLYKQSPLGWIPKDWSVQPLSGYTAYEITYGIVQAGPHIPDGVPYIRTGDMAGDALIRESMLCTSRRIANSYARSEVRTGEIVMAIRATVGKVLPVPDDLDGANLTQGTARISPNGKTDGAFLLWAIRHSRAQKAIQLEVKGTTFAEITLGALRQVPVAAPMGIDEQCEIAKRLTAIDWQLALEKDKLAKQHCQKSGLMDDLLTGRVRVTPLLEGGAA